MFRITDVQAFCSKKCMNGARLKKKKKSNSKVSGSTRRMVFDRFKHMCAYCGRSGRFLQIHHIKYRSEGVDHSLDNLILLCEDHHMMVHSNKRKWQPMLKQYVSDISKGDIRGYGTLPLVEIEWDKEEP
jgi:5-methylcytosine-specific restriction endonuclease McrA